MDIIVMLALGGVLGWMAGYGHGFCAKQDRLIATAPEDEMLREIKRRRVQARLESEIDKQVEAEVGRS